MKLFTRIGTRVMREPAAFRRLCVETNILNLIIASWNPAAFRRLCVETIPTVQAIVCGVTSRLQAAVC